MAVDVDEADGYDLAGYVEVEAAGREVRPDAGYPVTGDHYVELSHNGSIAYPEGRAG